MTLAQDYRREKRLNTPPNLPPVGRLGQAQIVHDILPDPYQRGYDQETARNVRHDVLEMEHKRGRLATPKDPHGDAAYLAGLTLQRAFEIQAGNVSGGGQWGDSDRGDATIAATIRMIKLIDSAAAAVALVDEVLPVLGKFTFWTMRQALDPRERNGDGAGKTFYQIAALFYFRPGKYEVWHVAESFRRGCRDLADHWAVKGAVRILTPGAPR